MLHFLRLVTTFWLATAALIGGAMLIGHANPQPDRFHALGFDTCDGRLCFLGIVPGVTKWEDAVKALNTRATLHSIDERTYYFGHIRVEMEGDFENHIHPIVIDLIISDEYGTPLPVNIGDFVAQRGIPCAVSLPVDAIGLSYLGYLNESLSIRVLRQRLDPLTPIDTISIPSEIECNDTLAWHGFTAVEHYIQTPN